MASSAVFQRDEGKKLRPAFAKYITGAAPLLRIIGFPPRCDERSGCITSAQPGDIIFGWKKGHLSSARASSVSAWVPSVFEFQVLGNLSNVRDLLTYAAYIVGMRLFTTGLSNI